MDPDQTAPTLFVKEASKTFQQMTKQVTKGKAISQLKQITNFVISFLVNTYF